MAARRHLVLVLSLSLLLSDTLHGGSRRRAVAASLPSEALSITFVDAGISGTLDAGTISWSMTRGSAGQAIAKRTFGMRIGRPSREAQGSVTLRAFLETADRNCTVRLDGIVLSTRPQVIRRHAPIGIVTTHQLQIEVPPSAPEGALAASIGWEITTD